jgi:hypothetical protein
MVRIMMRIFSQLNAAIAYAEGDRATKLPEPHAWEPAPSMNTIELKMTGKFA